MENNEKVNEVITLINLELENCDNRVYPQVCGRISAKESRDQVIESIVDLIAKNKGMTISGAIAQIESELEESVGE